MSLSAVSMATIQEASMAGDQEKPVQPVSGTVVPRYAGPSTFARLPELRDVPRCAVAILAPWLIQASTGG